LIDWWKADPARKCLPQPEGELARAGPRLQHAEGLPICTFASVALPAFEEVARQCIDVIARPALVDGEVPIVAVGLPCILAVVPDLL